MKLVSVSAYDRSWPDRYEREAPLVAEALGAVLVEIEHVGSTSVPGLAAKPTIDIAVGARSLELDADSITSMARLGYEYRGEVGVPGRRYFRKGAAYPRDFNVHVVPVGGQLWQDYVGFRDYLRAHPGAVRRYTDIKRGLSSTAAGHDPARYAEGKASFIDETLARVRQWRPASLD